MADKTPARAIERAAKLRWVPLNKMRTNPLAQRDLNNARVDKIASEMDLEQFGVPTVSLRDGIYYIVDGQHRIQAYIKWSGPDWEQQTLQCWVYEGLSADEEAEIFLKLNDILAVNAFSRFRVAVQAQRPIENDIVRVVEKQGLKISKDKVSGSIKAVGTLRRIYLRSGPDVLGRTLTIANDAYGDAGLQTQTMDGLSLFVARYDGTIDDADVVDRLQRARGALGALHTKASVLRERLGQPVAQCVAAAAVEIYNSRRGGTRLPSWWKEVD
jgi:hypothetical protein